MRRLGPHAHTRPVYVVDELHELLKMLAEAEDASAQVVLCELLLASGLKRRLLRALPGDRARIARLLDAAERKLEPDRR